MSTSLKGKHKGVPKVQHPGRPHVSSSKPTRSAQKAAYQAVPGAASANARQFHARQRQQQRDDERAADDDDHDDDGEQYGDEDGDGDEEEAATAPSRGITLDMIASSTSHSANKLQLRAHTPKHTPRPPPQKRARDEDEDDERPATHISTSTVVSSSAMPAAAHSSAAASSAAAAAAAASSGVAAALPSAPAATGAGGLFSDVQPPLDGDILRVLDLDFGFARMTPVQQQCIPTMLRKDVAVQSYTGSGKSIAFVVPMLQILLNKFTLPGSNELSIDPHTVGAIILSPTRELATQICSVIAPFVHGGKHAGPRLGQFRLAQFIGGSAMSTVEQDFVRGGGNIIVGTPGRLNSTLGKLVSLQTKDLRVLILDEADRLLDEGFSQDITDILRKLPKQRRTGLFSATQTRQVKELRRAGLQDKFAKIDVLLSWKSKTAEAAASAAVGRTQMTPTTLQNWYTVVRSENKLNLLVHFICAHAHEKVIIFFLTGDQVDYYSRVLAKLKALQGRSLHKKLYALRGGKQGMEQSKRNAQLAAFVAEKEGGILLATDVASRGLDVPDVEWIVQFDPPKDPSVFVHRIGRTARMGKDGSAIVYLTPEERPYVELIRGLNVPIDCMSVADTAFEANHSWKNDPFAKEIAEALEQGKNAQAIEAIKRKQQKQMHAMEESKKATNAAAAASASAAATASDDSGDGASTAAAIGLLPGDRIKSVIREVKYMSLEDRAVMERAQKAFTSYVDGYKQHVMSHALNYTRLPYADLAMGMGLLYMPKMPDIKHLTSALHYERAPVKAHAVRFRDAKLQAEHEKKEAAGREKNQKEQEERENKYKERQKKLQEAGPKRKKKLSQVIRDEWDELQNENRLLKKLKQGKISKKEFEIAVGERKKNGKERGVGSDDDDGSDFDSDMDSDMGSDSDDEAPPKKKAKTAPAAASTKGKQQAQTKGKQTAATASNKKKGKQAAAASESDMSDVSDDDE